MPILSGFSRSITPLWLRRMLGVLAWGALALYFAIGLTVLALRYLVLPNVDSYRGDIERSLSTALGQPVTIGALDARWNALWPRVRVHDLAILDIQGRPALAFKELEADIAWSSVWHLAPHFARLEINAPSLNLRRETDGRFFVAGIEIKRSATPDSGFADWLLAQDSIVIRDASIIWNDALRKAPELALTHVNFQLDNQGSRHRFGLTAEPPRELAARLDLRGDFHLGSIDALAAASGKAYVELDYADLAGWQTWVDYPVEVVRGYGGLRLWFDLERDSVMAVTADVRLSRTITRLASDLP
ncbi:MAG: TIGR02099 family protein, partial [Zoogloeaceae bacterium]|nr:TIGR02099 family protein [Zoogloeaceae bacterium]